MAKKAAKTNAVRIIEQRKITHELIEYETVDGQVDGESVAKKIGHLMENVFKTLVTTNGKGEYFIFVVPVLAELNLKAAAKVAGVKKIEMIAVKDLLGLTGYVRGGCSPVGMKKQFPTWIDESAQQLEFMIVSAGKIGMQVKLAPTDLATVANAKFAAVTAEKEGA